MHELGILYEVGKLRMHEFIEDAERTRMLAAGTQKKDNLFAQKGFRISQADNTCAAAQKM